MLSRATLLCSLAVLAAGLVSSSRAQHEHGSGSFIDELFDPVLHTHFSRKGTPFVHPFTFEPPQIHQDVFFIYRYAHDTIDGSDEHEAEAHVDWALTRRLGIVFGMPLNGIEQANGVQSAGLGDLEIGPRAMLIDWDYFILSLNLYMTIPTGDASRGLGAGETVISPYITTWHDLGNWNTLLWNIGPQVGTLSGGTAMQYAFSLTHSWKGRRFLPQDDHGDHEHAADSVHFPPGMTTLYLEMNGETELQGLQRTFVELMPGISYVLAEHAELRFGVLLPVSTTKRFDQQYYSSFTWIY